MENISLFQAFVLGILEGLTEFIPVSSTGHLILLGHAIGATGPKAKTFEIFIQLGAILAVAILYRKRFFALFDFSGPDQNSFKGRSAWLKLAAAALPVCILGAAFGSKIKSHLFNPLSVAVALVVGGLLMIISESIIKRRNVKSLEEVSIRASFTVGLIQSFALWPGMSRSASTIIGGMFAGFERRLAAEFSFLVAVPVMSAACVYDLLKSLPLLAWSDAPVFAFGFLVSMLSALLAVRIFIAIVARVSLVSFALYRIALGVLVLAL